MSTFTTAIDKAGIETMRQVYTPVLVTLVSLLLISSADAASINLATNGTATASSTWLPSTSPDKAIDGDNNTGWNSGNVSWFSPQWIEIDLGQISTINQITGFVDQWPNGYTKHNIYLDGIFNFTWEGYTEYSYLLSHTFQSPVTAQKVKIETTVSPSWVAWKEIQIFQEVKLPSAPTSVPEPVGIFGISTFAGLGLILKRRQTKQGKLSRSSNSF